MDKTIQTREKLILRLLVLDSHYRPEDLSILVNDIDFQNERLEYPLMVGILGAKENWRDFPDTVQNRLEGIYKSVRLRNIYSIPWFTDQCRILKEMGIPVLLLKGMAMRTYYAPDLPRQMSDFDIAIPPQRFEEAMGSLLNSETGNTKNVESFHAVHVVSGGGKVIDLHHWIFKTHGDQYEELLSKAIPVKLRDLDLLVPDPVTMFIHILDSRVRDDIRNFHVARRIKWLLDSALIVNKYPKWDWATVALRANELGALNYLKDSLPIFSDVFPELLPDSDLKRFFPQDKKYLRWKSKVTRYHSIYSEYNIRKPDMKRLTLKNICFKLRYYWSSYSDYYGPELKASGEIRGFLDYLCMVKKEPNVSALIRQFIRNHTQPKQTSGDNP